MKRRQRVLEYKIKELAAKHNVPIRTIMEVEDSMWKMIKQLINETNNETEESSNIYLRFLGTIFVAPGKIRRIKERIKEKFAEAGKKSKEKKNEHN